MAEDPNNPPPSDPPPSDPPPSDPPPSDPPPGTIAGGKGDADPPPAGSWPDDWRAQAAGEDDKTAKLLERFNSPAALAKAYREAQATISGGLQRGALPENPTDEQLAAYREANGIPDEAGGYIENMPDGIVIGEADKEMAHSFLTDMHEINAPGEFVHKALAWYNGLQEQQEQAMAQADTDFHNESINALREEWGPEYQQNVNSISNTLEMMGVTMEDGVPFADFIGGARGPDGRLLGDNPAFLKTMLTIATQINPAGVTMPGEGLGQLDSVTSELEQIEKLMQANDPAYWEDQKKQERYRQLLTAKEKLAAQAG